MNPEHPSETGEEISPVSYEYEIFESINHPVCIISVNGMLIFGNEKFRHFFQSDESDVRLDWEHPFFPEYRKRIANAYLNAINGIEKKCFAMMNSSSGSQIPVEMYLFPMYKENKVISIMALLRIVDERLLSFDRSSLSIISEENFKYDNLHFQFSPVPIIRVDQNKELINCSHSFEGFIGYSNEEILEKKKIDLSTIFLYDSEKIKKAVNTIINGDQSFQRIGEVKITTKDNEEKIVNLVLYPIVQNNEISSIEIVMEDITKIKELKDILNKMNRVELFSDITKGFLHSLSNTINVVLSKTQLLLQITEKESVTEGIQIIEESASSIVDQIRRIQKFIGEKDDINNEDSESLVNIIEDAIEFSKMQFKVEDQTNKRTINIERKYFSNVFIKTNTKLLREIIISIIMRVSNMIGKKGTLNIDLKKNNDLFLNIMTEKSSTSDTTKSSSMPINIFSGIDIRQVSEKLGIKIIEEESKDSYTVKAIFPQKLIIDKFINGTDTVDFKIRDLDIIVVEDEMALQKILYELFDKMGNRVFICDDGDDALEEFKRKHYDLVVTDYGIPGLTGIELAARIKEISEETTTILLSGWIIDDIDKYKNIIDLFMQKPFKLDDLIKNISKIIKSKKK